MRRSKSTLAACSAVAIATLMTATDTHALLAQALSEISTGTRIRVTVDTAPARPLVGSLVGQDGGSIQLRMQDVQQMSRTGLPAFKVVSVLLSKITRLELSRGRHSNAGKGAMYGGLTGAGAGLVIGLAATAGNGGGFFEVGPGEVALGTLVMGGLGAGVGAIIGSLSSHDQWEVVSVPKVTAVRQSVTGSRLGVGISLRF